MPNSQATILKKPQMIKKDVYIFHGMNVSFEGFSLPTLLIDHDDLILLGIPLTQDFFKIITAISSIAPIEKLKYVVAFDTSPLFLSVMNLFANASLMPTIVTSKANTLFQETSLVKQPLYFIEDHQYQLVLSTGKLLQFIETPFMPKPGSFIAFDHFTKTLFSNYLFETKERYTESSNNPKWIEDAIQTLQVTIPSSDFIHPIIEKIKELKPEVCITTSNKIVFKSRLEALLIELDRIEFSNSNIGSISRKINRFHDYSSSIQKLIIILIETYTLDNVKAVFEDSNIKIDDSGKLVKATNTTEIDLWNNFFNLIYAKHGLTWIAILEKKVNGLVSELGYEIPSLFSSQIIESERKNAEIAIEKLKLENKISQLETQLDRTVGRLMKDPLTRAYNELFLSEYLKDEINVRIQEGFIKKDIALIYINIDNILRLNAKYSKEVGDETIQNLGYLLNQIKKEGDIIFKRSAPGFIYYANKQDELAIVIAQRIQNAIRESDTFVEKITASLSIVKLSEFSTSDPVISIVQQMMSLGENRIKLGAIKGTNVIVDAQTKIDKPINGKILIVDDEQINLSLLKSLFFNLNYEIVTAKDGLEALEIIKNSAFDVIICERNVPKIDGISLKLAVNDLTNNAKAMFVLLTYNKNKDIVLRANQLGVDYVLQKPVLFEELLGFIQRFVKLRRSIQ